MIIATYARISTDDKGQTLETQRHAIGEYLARSSLPSPTAEFSDTLSGATFARPGFLRMMADAREKKFDHLVVFALDRVSRDFMGMMQTLSELSGLGIRVDTIDGEAKFTSPQEQFLASLRAYIAAEERQKLSDRVRAGMARARAQGSVFGAPAGNTRARGFKKVYSPDLVAKVHSLRKLDLTLSQIAEQTGFSRSKVILILRRNPD